MPIQPFSQPALIRYFSRRMTRISIAFLLLLGAALGLPQPVQAAAFTVNTTADTVDAAPGNGICADSFGSCSLRAAIMEANATAAADTIFVPAGTYTLTIPNRDPEPDHPPTPVGWTNEDESLRGDLDINTSLILQGAGAGSTIIQAGTNANNGIDKVMGVNPYCNPGINATIDGVTIRYGRNTQPTGIPDFAYTGGGLDWCAGVGDGTFTFSNSVVSDNTNVNGYGGGLNVDTFGGLTTVNISNVAFSNNQTLSPTQTATGGAINLYGNSAAINITNSTFTGNHTTNPNSGGGAIFFRPPSVGHLTISGSTFTNNTSAGVGGAISTDIWGTGTTVNIGTSTFTGNTATNSFGGALYMDGTVRNTTPFSLTHLVISGNTAGQAGGGVYVGNSNVTLSQSLIVGNSAPTASGLRKSVDASTATATNNWWGCSTGPGAIPCDTASTAGGTLTFTPWYRDLLTASPSSIVTNQSTALTASFLTNSANGAVPPADLAEIIGRSVTWAATNGTLSSTQATVQAGGMATGSFLATSAGTAILSAKVDHDNTLPVSSNVLSLTINRASTVTQITTDLSAPSLLGDPLTVAFTVTGQFGNSPTAPTGTVIVSDGVDSCTGTVAAGSCNITLTTPGSRTLSASYGGDGNFITSTSIGVDHLVAASPTVTNVSSTSADGAYTTGAVIPVTVTFGGPVQVGGIPQLTLATGGTGAVVNYTAGSGTNTLTFEYTVRAGDASPDLEYLNTTSLALNGGTIRDAGTGTYDAILTLPAPGAAGSLGANKNLVIDTAAPTVTNVSSPHADGTFKAGEIIPITVTFSEPVSVAGTPQLTLETGAVDQVVNYSTGTGTNTLTFTYTVQAGDTSADLDYAGPASLALNGGVIQDAATNPAGLSLPSPGTAGSLAANKAIVIDTTAPLITFTSTPADPTNQSPFTFAFGANETVSGYNCTLLRGMTVLIGPIVCSSPVLGSVGTTGTYTLLVNATDLAGNSGSASYTWMADLTPPDTTIQPPLPANPSNIASASFTYTGSDVGSGVASFHCALDGAAFAPCASPMPQNYGGLGDGSHTFQVRAVDNAGNLDPTPAAYTWIIDTTIPTVTMISAAANPTNISPIAVTVQFSETVTGFVAGDITPTNGTVGSFIVVDGDTYTFELTPSAQGLVQADIAAGVAVDAAGNGNSAAQFSRTYDSVEPAVTIEQAASQIDPTSVSPVHFTVVFSEPVSGFSTSDVTLGGSTGATTGTITETAPNDGTTYDVAVSGMTQGGTVIATIAAGVAEDAAANLNAASTSTDNTVTFTFTTTTDLVSVINPALAGQTVTFTATVSSTGGTPTGMVEFREGAALLSAVTLDMGGQAVFSTPALTVGTHSITAYYLGSAQHNASSSATLDQVINKADTTTSLASSGSPSGFGAPVTFTTTVTAVAPGAGIPTGTVEFFDGPTSLGTGTLDAGGQATLTTATLLTGVHTLTATYGGDASFNGSTSPAETQVVEGPPSVTLINSVADTGDGRILENEYTLAPLTQLLVVFSKAMNQEDAGTAWNYHLVVDGSAVDLVNGAVYNNAAFTTALDINGGTALPEGPYTLTVEGNLEDTLGVPIGLDFIRHFTVGKAPTTTTITSDAPDPSQVGESVTIDFTVTSSAPGAGVPTGNVTVTDGTDSCTATVADGSCAIAFTSPGRKTLTASYAGDSDFNASTSAPASHTVGQGATTTLITSDLPDPSAAGVPLNVAYTVTVTAPGTGTPTGNVTVTDGTVSCTGTVAAGSCSLILTTIGVHSLTATFTGDANFGGSTSIPESHTVEGPPQVFRINSVADTGDGQVLENERVHVAVTQLLVLFTKDMNAQEAGVVKNYHLVLDSSPAELVDGAVYNNATRTTTLTINGGVVLPDGQYTLTVSGSLRDTLGAPIGTDFIRHFMIDRTPPLILTSGVVGQPGDVIIVTGSAYTTHFTSLRVTFNEDVANEAGGVGSNEAANSLNYLLLRPGSNTTYETVTCAAFSANGHLPLGDDVLIPAGPVTYTNGGGSGPFVAAVTVNHGLPLPDGEYRLLVCGTTSIVDLAANPLNGGVDSLYTFTIFTVAALPDTGFAPGVVTHLPERQPSLSYTNLGGLWITVPRLGLKAAIVGVPASSNGWDVSWLGSAAGWLNGTAYPGASGNSVLTGHVYMPNGRPGPFVGINTLAWGDQVILNMNGQQYVYEVREVVQVDPSNIKAALKHQDRPYLTLLTCRGYDQAGNAYRYRVLVRAVLISVK